MDVSIGSKKLTRIFSLQLGLNNHLMSSLVNSACILYTDAVEELNCAYNLKKYIASPFSLLLSQENYNALKINTT